MGKVCISCGVGPSEPKKGPEEDEDCENCGGEQSVKGQAENSEEEDAS